MGAVGLVLLFAPEEVGPHLGLGGGDASLAVQLFGSALAAFGMLNWAGRGAIYGGIYGRPIALGNFLLGVLVVTGLGRQAQGVGAWIVVGAFLIHTMGFASVLFGRGPGLGRETD